MLVTVSGDSLAQGTPLQAVRILPESSSRVIPALGTASVADQRAHTNIAFFVPASPIKPFEIRSTGVPVGLIGETPGSVACIYRLVPQADGCHPAIARETAKGGSHVIVVVGVYHSPKIQADLDVFSTTFELPRTQVQVIYADGTEPILDPTRDIGWEAESSLDVQWAHAMAPAAKIVLVEAASPSLKDVFRAVEEANKVIAQYQGGQVSLSWGDSEAQDQSTWSNYLSQPGASYFAATGDFHEVSFPAANNQVVAVGGTSVVRDSSGKYLHQEAWERSGAGDSAFESKPAFQAGVPQLKNGNARGVADISAIAAVPNGGLFIQVSRHPRANSGWLLAYGTSASTPILAGIANVAATAANRFPKSSAEVLNSIYSNMYLFDDVKTGKCGKYSAATGWDYCTGVGTPNGYKGF